MSPPFPFPSSFSAARALSLQLVGRRSPNGSADEAAFAPFLAGVLQNRPALAAAGVEVRVSPVPGDRLGRANVYALLRGRGSGTVLLTGHFDTVGTKDYGDLEPLATVPDELARALLDRRAAGSAPDPWIDDVASGAFLPGRGLLDMKSGLAAAVVAMEAYASRPERVGNLLLVASPDEEDRSVGMRAAAQEDLPALLAKEGLRPELAINLDALNDDGDGAEGQVVALGAIGKLLLCAYVVGREAHACYPAAGVNAAVLAAALVRAFEGNAALADEGDPDAAPPATLGLRDLKDGYDVTTPGRAFAYWNVLTCRRTAREMLDNARRLAAGATVGLAGGGLEVLTFADLHARAARRGGAAFAERFRALGNELSRAEPALDLPAQSVRLFEAASAAAGLGGPAVVLGFASAPYPACRLAETGPDAALRAAVEGAARGVSARFDTAIAVREHLRIISDMSFVGPIDADDLATVAANTPVWGSALRWAPRSRPTPGIPCINAGPWGRDYHTARERVHQRYAFEVLPALVEAITTRVLTGANG